MQGCKVSGHLMMKGYSSALPMAFAFNVDMIVIQLYVCGDISLFLFAIWRSS